MISGHFWAKRTPCVIISYSYRSYQFLIKYNCDFILSSPIYLQNVFWKAEGKKKVIKFASSEQKYGCAPHLFS